VKRRLHPEDGTGRTRMGKMMKRKKAKILPWTLPFFIKKLTSLMLVFVSKFDIKTWLRINYAA
jgi:hypothetical protein